MVAFGFVLVAKLFYVQIIRHDHYQQYATKEHSRLFNPSSPRGLIYLSDTTNPSPVVLNIIKYTVIADPAAIKNPNDASSKLSTLLNIERDKLKSLISVKSRYAVLAKKIDKDTAEKIKNLKITGITLQENNVRTYPQGALAAQVLGFVNDDGQGQYGVEQALNNDLSGKPGKVYQVTDVNGVPLVLGDSVVEQKEVPPKDVTLTIDIAMQNIVEQALSSGVKDDGATQGSAIIMEANTGAIKAMADFPNYDPTTFSKVSDPSIFSNTAVSNAWEPGSVMKPLLLGTAFSLGKANPDTSYVDTNSVVVDGSTIKNSINWGTQTMTLKDVINKSLNVGAVFALKTLGATDDQIKKSQYSDINNGSILELARKNYYDYLVNHYMFANYTGIEQAGESKGFVNDPFSGDAINLRYANMAFGQGLSVTPIQLVAAYAALTNGGTYYKPTLVQSESVHGNTFYNLKPQIVKSNVVTPNTSQEIRTMLQNSLAMNNSPAVRQGYIIGAKSGTAQQADGKGGYKTDAYNGAYVGFVGGDNVKYIILVRLDGPKTSGFASAAAAKVWTAISNQLLNDFPIAPKTN